MTMIVTMMILTIMSNDNGDNSKDNDNDNDNNDNNDNTDNKDSYSLIHQILTCTLMRSQFSSVSSERRQALYRSRQSLINKLKAICAPSLSHFKFRFQFPSTGHFAGGVWLFRSCRGAHLCEGGSGNS